MTLRFGSLVPTTLLTLCLVLCSSIARAQEDSDSATDASASATESPASAPATQVGPAVSSDVNNNAGSTKSGSTAAGDPPPEPPPGYQEELDRRIAVFEKIHQKLIDAVAKQRAIMIRYLNREERNAAARKAYRRQRSEVRRLMDEAYDAGLDIVRIGPHNESAQFMMTWIQNRLKHDIYDVSTLEGAVRLIDGGAQWTYLYQAAARSAVVVGDFDLAKRLYDSIPEEQMEEIDLTLEYHLEEYREAFEQEQALREKEEAEDRLPRVKLVTTQGEVIVELFIDQAPSAVSHFIQLVEKGYYDGNDFLQVVDHLLALTGDPSGTGTGNTGQFLKDEHQRPDARKALRGSLLMAKMPLDDEGNFLPDSASSQFAILFLPMISASEKQTVFGRVIKGMDSINRLRRNDPSQKKDKNKLQLPPDYIIEAEVIRRPESLPEPEYLDLESKARALQQQQQG